jgi:hypothetical protein
MPTTTTNPLTALLAPTLTVVQMPYAEWAGLPDHPRQRPTEKRLKKVRRKHLASDHISHGVTAAVEFGGVTYKVDGHTRTSLWEEGKLTPPATLWVAKYVVKSPQEFLDLYYVFDSREAGKDAGELILGMANGMGLSLQSSRFKNRSWKSALDQASGRHAGSNPKRLAKLVEDWSEELVLADNLDLPKWIKSDVMAGIFLTLRRYGAEIVPFWKAVLEDEGVKNGPARDATQMAVEVMNYKWGAGYNAWRECYLRLATCARLWVEGRGTVNKRWTPRSVTPAKVVDFNG